MFYRFTLSRRGMKNIYKSCCIYLSIIFLLAGCTNQQLDVELSLHTPEDESVINDFESDIILTREPFTEYVSINFYLDKDNDGEFDVEVDANKPIGNVGFTNNDEELL